MYHSISGEPEPGVPPYYQTNTSPDVFRRHMQFLADHDYRTIRLDELVTFLRTPNSVSHFTHHRLLSMSQPSTLSSQPPTDSRGVGQGEVAAPHSDNSQPSTLNHQLVAITFDDGFRDFFTEAFPILENHGYTATMFLPTAFIGDTRRCFRPSTINYQPSTRKECLTWTEITELRQAGIQFGSHTVNHPKLVELSWSGIQSELSNSKSDIEQHLGEPVSAFCYPFAFPQTNRSFARAFRDLVVQTGYSCCATTELGRVHPGSDPFRLKRLPANALDDNALLAAKLEGAYDWMAAPQSAVKTMKAFLRPQPSAKNPVPAAGAPSNPSRLVGSAER